MNPEQAQTATDLTSLLTAVERAYDRFSQGERLLRLAPTRGLVVHELGAMRATCELMLTRYLKAVGEKR